MLNHRTIGKVFYRILNLHRKAFSRWLDLETPSKISTNLSKLTENVVFLTHIK